MTRVITLWLLLLLQSQLCNGLVVPSKHGRSSSNCLLIPRKISGSRPHRRGYHQKTTISSSSSSLHAIMDLRGGGDVVTSIIPTITSSLQNSGSSVPGLLSLWAIASSVVIPLTLCRQGYSFSVGYGFSVMAMGLACLLTFQPTPCLKSPPFLLVTAAIFYGFRLGSFLVLRNATVPSKAQKLKEFDKSPPLKRIPLAINVSLLYAFMTSPALFALQSASTSTVAMGGASLAWLGAIMESVADGQKFLVKRSAEDEETFVGPTGGFYALCRHPNYLGEILFWLGLYVGGLQSFVTKPIAMVCTTLGLTGIVFIMKMATKRLDKQQGEKYAGQDKYDTYKTKVPFPLIPFVSG